MSFESFLTKENFEGYEDPEKFKQYEPKLQAYRKDLEDNILEEYKIELPKPRKELIKDQFNSVEYLYSHKLLTPEEFEITDSTASTIVKNIENKKWTAVQVFKAFAHRGTIAHQFTNCAFQLFPKEGLERAKQLDEYQAKNGKLIGPLHGLPISVKEQANFKGKITHGGYVGCLDNIPEKHGASNQILEDLGAVFYIRTSQPQTLMHLDSGNNFTGFTKNPFNLLLSSGGSSSGEGAIVGFGGSILGVGSDIGGSVRAPAAYSGCHGFRPTTRRLGTLGGVSSGAGQESVPAVYGPFARSMEDIELYMKSCINDGKPWDIDAWAIYTPWREVETPKPENIMIAVMKDDGLVRVSPPIRRGIEHTAKKLKEAGFNIVEFNPPNTKLAYETVNKMYSCDGNYMQKLLLSKSGEPLQKLTKWALNYGSGSELFSSIENRKLNVIRDNLRNEYNDYLVKNKIDFILSPAYNNVAPHSGEVYNWSYTALFNILDMPTLAFQTGLYQDPKIDIWTDDDKNYKYRSDLEKLENENYKPEEFIGAPIGLQLTGKRYKDEEVIAAGKFIVDDILKVDLLHH
ncbi:uncharacterized protein KGF55_005119 [Candida pseudojiufengensis]|uniref:uncharacterized protein n=1 Tax=Candida pseudojiufengensis TaxID=497109 RepID=UPI0022250A47|nr:uncharacterized protein KGF55_005119 [Candida pseudojiufengensis]KAI5959887.1 hypothetical protein KGF55_005119 [Candida pseudojiufengensis]